VRYYGWYSNKMRGRRAKQADEEGVIAESVPYRTLSGIEEGGARISQRPKPLLERL